MWKWRLKETGGIDVYKWQSKLMGSMDGTNWELLACSEEGKAEGDILATIVTLNGTVVTISLYLKIWLKLNSTFLLLLLFRTLFSKQDSCGKGRLAALGSNALSLSLGTVSPCTFPVQAAITCPPVVAVARLSCKEWCCSRRHLGETTHCWALGLRLFVILPEAWAPSPFSDTSVSPLLFLLLWSLLFASFIFLGKWLNRNRFCKLHGKYTAAVTWPEAFIGNCYILLQSLFCTQFLPARLWRGYCWGNNFLVYLFVILFFQLTGERKSLSKNGFHSQAPSLKVWCNFDVGRVWSRNFWMKFPNLCCAEFIAWGISLDITFNQQESFNCLLSSLAAHGQVFGAW